MGSVSSNDDFSGPQDALNEFWENLITKKPCKITNIFPSSLYANLLPPQRGPGPVKGKNAAESYEAAAKECRARVKQIIRECHRTNEKFTDPDFDIEYDLGDGLCFKGLMTWYDDPQPSTSNVSSSRLGDALATLAESDLLASDEMLVDLQTAAKIVGNYGSSDSGGPGSVHRIEWIFDKPSFTVDGFSSSDVRQGHNGDCWFIAALTTICSNPTLMEKVCVMADEECQECGVYGFVFYRDGEWIWTVVDDNLYVLYRDFDAYGDQYDPTGSKERKYKKNNQTGSEALYFASCADQNETWLPLLEKAYAKAHGDYDSIAGGFSGEAVEDLTGGVTSKILTNRILSKERLWKELLEVNKQFLFAASSPGSYGDDSDARQGLALSHAYSIIKAVEEEDEEGNKHRLVLIRNPWGKRANASMGEWNGPWSDGSEEWTPYWMKKLNHRFGNDGLFWMSYDDLRKKFDLLDRTRLFDKEWTVVQNWTSVSVAWVTGFLNTKFVVEIKKAGPTVFVLCQLDDRYFRGLQGKYTFDLHFILQEENAPAGDHIIRARGAWFGNRSISAEVTLDPGKYEVIPKIVAERDDETPDVYDVVTKVADRSPQKLRQIGMNYDIANAKGAVQLTDEEKKKREEKKKAAKEKKQKEKEEAEKEKAEFESWKKEKKEREKKEKSDKEKTEEGEASAESKTSDAKETEKEKAGKEDTPTETKESDTKEGASQPAVEKGKEEVTKGSSTPGTQDPVKDSKDEKPKKTVEQSTNKSAKDGKEDRTEKEEAQSSSEPATQPKNEPSGERGPPPAEHTARGAALHLTPPPPPSAYGGSYASGPPSPALGPAHSESFAAADVPTAPAAAPAEKSAVKSWNAICVLGLRVYSKDPEVSIKLVKPKSPEEAALLDVDGVQAGATT